MAIEKEKQAGFFALLISIKVNKLTRFVSLIFDRLFIDRSIIYI